MRRRKRQKGEVGDKEGGGGGRRREGGREERREGGKEGRTGEREGEEGGKFSEYIHVARKEITTCTLGHHRADIP